MAEKNFEDKLIENLTTGQVTSFDEFNGLPFNKKDDTVFKTRLWKYEPQIKTTEKLWDNFKSILEQHNQAVLDQPLSVTEFAQVKNAISNLHTPYQAGQFLYGLNGVSQIEVDLDDGRHVFLTVFDQDQIGAGDTVYQVVNQIQSPAKIPGKTKAIFDVTLLINGLPIVQIELKDSGVPVNNALNQMERYINENQYSDIFSTVQLLVAMTPDDAKYMANTTQGHFNKDFAFHWQTKNESRTLRDWKEFSDCFLSIPMAHQMATSFMILDGTPHKESLKVMRPYQVYATRNVLEKVRRNDFEYSNGKLGYIWHTTGSGKTITSFKTAWLSSRLPNVDKVVFLVDRKALTRQTHDKYNAYNPESSGESMEKIADTKNTKDLANKLLANGHDIIVTSVQKLERLARRDIKAMERIDKAGKHILFIVDEAHRSTGGPAFQYLQSKFTNAAWIGYTGTPTFDDQNNKVTTADIFGECLHSYTIRDAISDKNVLGFKVEFQTTIDQEAMKTKYLPDFYARKYPSWSEEQIQEKIDNLSPEDMDDTIETSFYDENEDHAALVVEDIVSNWDNRSNERMYNALFTTHKSGGAGSSIPMAMMYFRKFMDANKKLAEEGKEPLKIAITFSQDTSNGDNMNKTNASLEEAMSLYNKKFGTSFALDSVPEYFDDVVSRLNKTSDDGKFLDLCIVVDQLLTGFDAPQLNTLYVDRTLKDANLIQAYSRTNRVENFSTKPFGNIINFRWPAYNEKLMNEALCAYSNKDNENVKPGDRPDWPGDLLAKPFLVVQSEVKQMVESLRKMTDDFNDIPASEAKQEEMLKQLRDYNAGINLLKQYPVKVEDGVETGFDYENPDKLIHDLGMSVAENRRLTTVLANELKEALAKTQGVPVSQIDLKMTHIKDVEVNYDYLTELLEDLLNQVHENKMEEAAQTKDDIIKFANGMEDRKYARSIKQATEAIYTRQFPTPESNMHYPYKLHNTADVVHEANNAAAQRLYQQFRNAWGLSDIVTNWTIQEMISGHTYGQDDMNDSHMIDKIITEGAKHYQELAGDSTVRSLTKIKYRKLLRKAFYELADDEKRD